MPRAPSPAQRPRSTIGPGLARSPNSSHCMARHDCGLAVACGSPGRPCHHPGPTKGQQPNTGITTNLEQISDDVAAGGTQAVLEHRGGQCGQRVGATTVKLQGWRAPAVSPGHVSRGLQRPQEPPWPGDWGLGAGGGPLLGENQAEGPTPPHPSIQLHCTPAGLAHLVPAREPQKSPSPQEWGCQAPVPLPLQAEVTSRGQNLQPGPLPWYPGSLDAHRPPPPRHQCPQPPAPPHRLMEGLHHGLGIVGFVVHYGLLQGLVIELLHVLGDLGKEVLTAQGDCPPRDVPSPGSLGRSGRTRRPKLGVGGSAFHSATAPPPPGSLLWLPTQRARPEKRPQAEPLPSPPAPLPHHLQMTHLVLVDKTPDASGHLTGKEDHQAGEELGRGEEGRAERRSEQARGGPGLPEAGRGSPSIDDEQPRDPQARVGCSAAPTHPSPDGDEPCEAVSGTRAGIDLPPFSSAPRD